MFLYLGFCLIYLWKWLGLGLPYKSLESESITSHGNFFSCKSLESESIPLSGMLFIWDFHLFHLRAPGNWKYSLIWDFRLYLGFSPFPLVNGQQRNQGRSDRRTDEPDPPTFHGPKGFFSAFHGFFFKININYLNFNFFFYIYPQRLKIP